VLAGGASARRGADGCRVGWSPFGTIGTFPGPFGVRIVPNEGVGALARSRLLG
jgi:hypothetical protein